MPSTGEAMGWPPIEPKIGQREAEDPAVGGVHAVAVAVLGRLDAHDRGGQDEVARRAREGGVEAEDPPVGGHQPVAAGLGVGGHGHHRGVEGRAPHRAEEGGVAEAEDPPVRAHQPVAAAVGGGGHAHDGGVEVHGPGRAVEGGVAEGVDPAVGAHQPVAVAARGGRHAHDRGRERPPPASSRRPGRRRSRRRRRRRRPASSRCRSGDEVMSTTAVGLKAARSSFSRERGPEAGGSGGPGRRWGAHLPRTPPRPPPGEDRVGGRRARGDKTAATEPAPVSAAPMERTVPAPSQ